MRSLRARLWLLWCLAVGASLAVGAVLVQLYTASSSAQVQRAEAVVARSCDAIRDRFGFYVTGWTGQDAAPDVTEFGRQLVPVLVTALASHAGVAGGIWSQDAGSLSYAFPTAPVGVAQTLPADALAAIRDANQAAAASEQLVLRHTETEAQSALLAACPLTGPYAGMTAWTMQRVAHAPGYDNLRVGLGVLLALVLGIAGWLVWMLTVWGRHLGALETALTRHDLEALPRLAPTGERELDRIVAALNDAGARLQAARGRAEDMNARVASAERLAALGRVAAGVAHEIRNPIAAMRLKAENALAGDPARLRPALQANLVQIARLDRLLTELLAWTQPRHTCPVPTALHQFMTARADEHRELAAASRVTLSVRVETDRAVFDPDMVARALDNLIVNAIQHTPPQGMVRLTASGVAGGVRITVADDGPGVDPALRATLFEPFVTGRPDGTGLGLAIARELAEAHGGHLTLSTAPGQGAMFVLDIPNTVVAAVEEPAWQPS